MLQEIVPNLFRIEIPLPGSPLKALNSYVLRSADRSLIVDTGFNRPECLAAMLDGLGQIGVTLERSDIFVTHLHVDHLGQVGRLARNKTFFGRTERETVSAWNGWEPMVLHAIRNGFPEAEARSSIRRHPAYSYGPEQVPELTLVDDGDLLRVGDFQLRCLVTPGHTPGHTCLYEPGRRLLLSGDHVLGDITPNIQCWSDRDDPLRDYLTSLDRVLSLEVDRVLPGHRGLVEDPRGRIDELQRHHRQRAAEILEILEAGPATAFEVAGRMTWDIECASWAEFPIGQKWFALGEALAHLRYLEAQGALHKISQGTADAFVKVADA